MIICIIFIALIIWLLIKPTTEHFNEQSGTFCLSCRNKTPNQCLKCFNCLYITDKWGHSGCIGGDANSGPYNNEEYSRIYSGDPFSRMRENNDNYRCSYGPMQANRISGEATSLREALSRNC